MTSIPQGRLSVAVFIDSSAFYAYLNRQDNHYEEAGRLMAKIAGDSLPLITTNFVVAEAHALILTRHSHRAATQFLRDLDGSAISIIRAQASDEDSARAIVFQYDDKRFSLTDAISFAVMERLGLNVAFTFDRNFSQYGFQTLQA